MGICQKGACVPTCQDASDCPSSNPCKIGACVGGTCQFQNKANGSMCVIGGQIGKCQDGVCVFDTTLEPSFQITSGVSYVTIRGSARTSLLIAKIWNGNKWVDPRYMAPESVEPPGPWSVQYILGASGTVRIGLFERGVDRGQDQIPVWVTEVELVPGEAIEIVVEDSECKKQTLTRLAGSALPPS